MQHLLARFLLNRVLLRTSVAVSLALIALACSNSQSTLDLSYMVTISPVLGTIADARDTYQEA